jgi:hypothetical protein
MADYQPAKRTITLFNGFDPANPVLTAHGTSNIIGSEALKDPLTELGNGRTGHERAASAPRIIWAKLLGSRLAPPTNAPSISGCRIKTSAFSGFTLPPY